MKYIQREPGYKWHLAYSVKADEPTEAVCGMKFFPTRQTGDRMIAIVPGVCRECESEAYHEAQLAIHDN
jgi:hypothetical protein